MRSVRRSSPEYVARPGNARQASRGRRSIGHGSVAGARAQLVEAQGFAANVSNAPEVDTLANLTKGINHAKRAAAELFLAEPRSEFQDLIAARQQVVEGQQLLEQAASVLTNWAELNSPTPLVKQLASDAFDAFEGVFEILDND